MNTKTLVMNKTTETKPDKATASSLVNHRVIAASLRHIAFNQPNLKAHDIEGLAGHVDNLSKEHDALKAVAEAAENHRVAKLAHLARESSSGLFDVMSNCEDILNQALANLAAIREATK